MKSWVTALVLALFFTYEWRKGNLALFWNATSGSKVYTNVAVGGATTPGAPAPGLGYSPTNPNPNPNALGGQGDGDIGGAIPLTNPNQLAGN